MKRHNDVNVAGLIKQLFTMTIKMLSWCKSNLQSHPSIAGALKLCFGLYAVVQAIKAAKEITPVVASRIKEIKEYNEEIYRKYGEEYKPLGNMLNAQKAIIKGLLATIAAGGIHLLSKEAAAQAAVVVSAASLSLAKSRLATAGKDYYSAVKFLRKSIRRAHKGIKKSVEAKAAQSVKVAEKKIDEAEKVNKEAAKATEEVKKVIKKENDPKIIEKAVASAKEAQDNAVKKTEEAVAAVVNVVESTNEAAEIVEKEEKALDKQEAEAAKKKAEEAKKTAQEAKNKAEEAKKSSTSKTATTKSSAGNKTETKKSSASSKTGVQKSSTSSKGTQAATKNEKPPVDLNATTELGVKIYYPSGRKKPKAVIEKEEKALREELEDVQKVNEKQAKREKQRVQQAQENQNEQPVNQQKKVIFDDEEVKYIYDKVKGEMEEVAKKASLDKSALDWVAKNFTNSDPLVKRSISIISSVISGRYLAERVCTRDKATVSNKQTIVEKSRRQSNAMEADGNYLFSLYRQIEYKEKTLNENNKDIAKKAEASILSISQCIGSLGRTLHELGRHVNAEVPMRQPRYEYTSV